MSDIDFLYLILIFLGYIGLALGVAFASFYFWAKALIEDDLKAMEDLPPHLKKQAY